MKTNGLIRIFAKHCIAFIFAIVIIVTVSAQVRYTSLKSFPSTVQKKDLVVNFSNYNNETEAVAHQYYVKPGTDNSLPNIETNIATTNETLDAILIPTSYAYPENSKFDIGVHEYSPEHLMLYARALKQYAQKNGYDIEYAFLSNLGILSNKKRFFVINLSTMKVEEAGLVSHGRGQGQTIHAKQYSNKAGSRSTSLGRYKILGKYSGSYGEAYRMAGLDSSNLNAFNRDIVLHSMGCIPDSENRMPACVSDGCPSVSPKFLSQLQQIIDSRKKPMLLWIFDSNIEELVFEGDAIYTKYVSDSEVYAAVPTKIVSEPQMFNDSFRSPYIDKSRFLNPDRNSNLKKNLLSLINFLRHCWYEVKAK